MQEPLFQELSVETLIILLFFLLLFSAFFSSSETGMMALNRYRLKHQAKHDSKAKLVAKLLSRPDRLLGVILIGNNFVNICASAAATLIGIRLYGEAGVVIATTGLTVVLLVFAEIMPKTLAAHKPERVAFLAVYPLQFFLWVMFPLVWMANTFANSLLHLFGIRSKKKRTDALNLEELRTVVNEASGYISEQHTELLTNLMDLDKTTVNDIMIPRPEVIGLDLADDNATLLRQLQTSQHTWLPVFQDDLNDVVGVLHMRDVSQMALRREEFDREALLALLHKPYFVPEETSLHTQMMNFQRNKLRFGLVVDEYGDLQGVVTLEDIIEEVIGEFTTDVTSMSQDIHPQTDGSYLIDGGILIRQLNRSMGWELPTDKAKTLSGLIIERLEMIPNHSTCVLIDGYPVEVVQVLDNMIKTARVSPKLPESKD